MSVEYSIPYLLFLLFLIVLMYYEFRLINNKTESGIFTSIIIVGYLIFFGLRGFVFSDWTIYYSLFQKVPTIWDNGSISSFNFDFTDDFSTNLQTGKSGMEIGFIYLIFIFKSIIPDYHAFLFFNVLIDITLLHLFIKRYSPYYALSVILFITFGGLLIEGDLLRNIKAMFLFLYSIRFIEKRKLIPYYVINSIGLLFHSSAIIFFPLYFFLHKECPKWLMWSIFIAGNLLFLFKISYIQPLLLFISDHIGGRLSVQARLYFAIEDYSSAYGLSIGYIERLISYLLVLIYSNRLRKEFANSNIFINAYILYFFMFFFLSEISIAVNRLTLLFAFSYWILYPRLFYIIKNIYLKIITIQLIICFSILKIITLTQGELTKYDNLLFGIESYESRLDTFYNYTKTTKQE